MRWIWIDTFVEFVSGERASAVKTVSLAEDHLHEYGGSPGVEFLKDTLFNPIFPDLWAIRHAM